jgi:hypothetical protein
MTGLPGWETYIRHEYTRRTTSDTYDAIGNIP